MTDSHDRDGDASADAAQDADDEHTRPTLRIDDDELAEIVRPDALPATPGPSLADDETPSAGLHLSMPPERKDANDDVAGVIELNVPPTPKADADADASESDGQDAASEGPALWIAHPPVNKAQAEAKTASRRPPVDDDDDDDDDDPFGADIDALDENEAAAAPEPPKDPPEISEDLLDKDALWVVRRLRAKGYEAYLTGGCVRDVLLGREPKDFDVATAATPNQVRSVFRNCRLVGRRFRLAHVYFPGNKVIETATFRANPLEASDEEDLPDDLLLERDNVFGNIEEDARRRDLTVNGLFYDPLAGKVLDYVDGRTDLEARLIRTIGDPQIRFQEDPVRIIRAIKFASRLEFDVEKDTLQAMKDHVGELSRCSPPRLQEEIVRLLTGGHAARAMKMCAEIGVFEILMKELTAGLSVSLKQAERPAPISRDEDQEFDDPRYKKNGATSQKPWELRAHDGESSDADDADENTDTPSADAGDAPDAAHDATAAEVKVDEAPAADANHPDTTENNAAEDKAAEDNAAENKAAESNADENKAAESNAAESNAAESKAGDKAADDATAEANLPPMPEVPSPKARQARFEALLESLDAVKSRGAEVTSAVAFATLLLPVWEAYLASDQDEERWLDALTTAWGDRLRLTRRDKDALSILFAGLEQLAPSNRFGAKARHLVSRPWFREALLLYIVANHAKGESLDDVAKWKAIAAHYQKPYAAIRPGEREPRPRRARRPRSGGGNGRGRRGR